MQEVLVQAAVLGNRVKTLYVTKDAKLSQEGETLLVKTKDGAKIRVPIENLEQIVTAGEAGLTTRLLGLCGKHRIRMTVLDWYGNVTGTFEPARHPRSGKVRLAQAEHALDPERRMVLARAFVTGGIQNMLANLRYRTYRGKVNLEEHVEDMKKGRETARRAESTEQLMGAEGNTRSWYYAAWPLINEGLAFGARKRRPPDNRINCLISWFNGLAYSTARNELGKTHLDDSVSFLHAPGERRYSLALDLAEIFKPAVCDTAIFEIVGRATNMESWFHEEEGVCRLSETGRKATLKIWINRTEGKEEGDRPTKGTILNEALALERHVLGIDQYKPWRRRV